MNDCQASIEQEGILIVDDSPNNLYLLSKMLAKKGYKVSNVWNGEMALSMAQTMLPSLILLDIMMPEMDGYEVCQKLKENPQTADIPVIFLSGLSDVFDKVKAFSVGGADYITKPFQLAEVLARVQNQLMLRATEVQNKQLNAQLEERVKERTSQLEQANRELKREIRERKLLEAQLRKMALYDGLTDLPNRVLFMDCLAKAIALAQEKNDYQFAVLFIDCDRFKIINDSLGHSVGDELLVELTYRLKSLLQPKQLLARFGGDEFAILLTDPDVIQSAVRVAENILKALSFPFQLTKREVFINASIGIALGNSGCDRPEHLLRDADTAMYRAKRLGKGQYRIFDPAMHEAAMQALQLENDLRRAVSQNELSVHYQPIVALSTGTIVGFEALARWYHPQRGFVSPALFIPIAEETGLINPIGNWVLREACCQLRQWQQEKLTDYPLTVSVNLSVRQFSQPNLIEQIDRILAETQLNPEFLKLEITESAIMENPKVATAILQYLRERNIQFSIDDFGTGYSSLSYLHSFPADCIKIDRSFVQRLDGNAENLGLVPAIVSIAKTLGMHAIAEGIETPKQLWQLKDLGCDLGQGYLFSKPLAGREATHLIASALRW